MGCGAVRRAQIVIYINEATPPFQVLVNNDRDAPNVYPASGIVKRGEDTYFDDKEIVKQCQAVHVDRVAVTCEQFITGVDITYCLDQAIEKRSHRATTTGDQVRLELAENESIISVECTSSSEGIHSILMRTNLNHELKAECRAGPGATISKVSFEEEKRGVVAFKGSYQKTLRSLGVYTWKMRRG